jgi:hypothetical protein
LEVDAVSKSLPSSNVNPNPLRFEQYTASTNADESPLQKMLQMRNHYKKEALENVLRSEVVSCSPPADSDMGILRPLRFSRKTTQRKRHSPRRMMEMFRDGTLWDCSQEFHRTAWSEESSPTGIFLTYLMTLHPIEISRMSQQTLEELRQQDCPSLEFFTESVIAALERYGCTAQDIRTWAWIILGQKMEIPERYVMSSCALPPPAIFMEILRVRHIPLKTLRHLIVYGQNRISSLSKSSSIEDPGILRDDSFMAMFCSLLEHARRVGPTLIPTISQLIVQYCSAIMSCASLDTRLPYRLNKICNTAICRLSLPCSKSPMESMAYAWKGQQIILKAGDSFEPALELNASSYRAIAKVLLANKKSDWEVEAVAHLHRTWPPWRKILDGMDAQTQFEDELTRVVRVVRNMMRAGYPPTSIDSALVILGGRDTDGTPTIPTRTIFRGSAQVEWVARIRATRDVQEAWGVFQACISRGNKPSQPMFDEMFEKLVFDMKRQKNYRAASLSPGDGKEVFAFQNDNLSDTEIQRLSPPHIDGLYEIMKSYKIKPSQRSLDLLIEHAREPFRARELMVENGIDRNIVRQLAPKSHGRGTLSNLSLPESTLTAYVKLLCRFSSYSKLTPKRHGGYTNGRKYLFDALRLLKGYPEKNPAAWLVVIKAMAQARNRKELSSAPYWWSVIQDSLTFLWFDVRKIDPDHFQFGCYSLYTTIYACTAIRAGLPGHEDTKGCIDDGLDFLRALFTEMTATAYAEGLPRLLYQIRGVHLHAYIRLLAIAGRQDEIVEVLRWMVEHQDELSEIAENKENGRCSLRRVLVAMRAFAQKSSDADSRYVTELRDLAEDIQHIWGGWPEDDEVVQYLEYHARDNGWMETDTV